MRDIIVEMDEVRKFRWTWDAIQKFESRAKSILKRQDILQPGMTTHTGHVLTAYIRMADILEAAVGAVIGNPEGAKGAIEAYLEKGGDLETLQLKIYEAYLVAADPSSLENWEADIRMEEETRRINREKANAKLEIARLELADDLAKIERLKKLAENQPGTTNSVKPPDSPTSN